MAVTLSADAQLVFFNKVFGLHSPTTERVKGLLGAGITFEVSLYAVRALLNGKAYLEPVKLSVGTTALMKGTVDAPVFAQNKKMIEDWVAYLYEKKGKPVAAPKPVAPKPVAIKVLLTGIASPLKTLPLIKAVHKVLGGSATLADAKNIVENPTQVVGTFSSADAAKHVALTLEAAGGITQLEVVGGTQIDFGAADPVAVVTGAKYVETFKPVDAVIHLKDAKAIGQKVHGTSTGSVYYTIAVGEHVKIAARLSGGGSVSIRTEWQGNLPQAETKKLETAGVIMKGNYGSVHFDAAGVPVAKIIGAFLMDTGLAWQQVVTNGGELVVGS